MVLISSKLILTKYEISSKQISKYYFCKAKSFYLVDNTRTWRNNKHVVKCRGAPLEKSKPFLIAIEFMFHVKLQCIFEPCHINLH